MCLQKLGTLPCAWIVLHVGVINFPECAAAHLVKASFCTLRIRTPECGVCLCLVSHACKPCTFTPCNSTLLKAEEHAQQFVNWLELKQFSVKYAVMHADSKPADLLITKSSRRTLESLGGLGFKSFSVAVSRTALTLPASNSAARHKLCTCILVMPWQSRSRSRCRRLKMELRELRGKAQIHMTSMTRCTAALMRSRPQSPSTMSLQRAALRAAQCGQQAFQVFGHHVQGFAANAKGGSGFAKPLTAKKKQSGGTEDPRTLAAITMLTTPEAPVELKLSKEQMSEADSRTAKYLANKEARNAAWVKDMQTKHKLQIDALRALPAALRAKAEKPDTVPFPPARKVLFDTPPTAYMAQP